jgi:hypothetical protein
MRPPIRLSIACAVVSLWSLLGVAGTTEASTVCPESRVRSHLSLIQTMPSIRRVPSNGILPFAPNDLRLLRPLTPLVVDDDSVSFRLESLRSGRSHRLGWRIAVQVARLGPSGRELGTLQARRAWLRGRRDFAAAPLILTVHLPQRSFYRVDLIVRDAENQILGRYSEYVRRVAYRVDAKLRSNRDSVAAGGVVAVRVINVGTASVSYSPMLQLERLAREGQWIQEPTDYHWPPVAVDLPGGSAGKCEAYRLPKELVPGSYRLSKQIDAGRRQLKIYATFSVD